MTVLVTAASRHGATQAIAHEIARQLRAAGRKAQVLEPEAVDTLDGIDAVVLGSAVYRGRWLPEARNLAARLEPVLGRREVWLFSSGPVGEPPRPTGALADAATAGRLTGARGHRVFAGRLDVSCLSRGERVGARRLHAGDGDYRDWHEIRCWATQIADQLAPDQDTDQDTDHGPADPGNHPGHGPIEERRP
jgi:menaquinone-dependent protoporphyrinogen oxidase